MIYEINKDALKILETFIKNCDNLEDAFDRVEAKCEGELREFTARNLKGYMAYGNGQISIFLDIYRLVLSSWLLMFIL